MALPADKDRASRPRSSSSSNPFVLLQACITPTTPPPARMGTQTREVVLKPNSSSTELSNLGSSYASLMLTFKPVVATYPATPLVALIFKLLTSLLTNTVMLFLSSLSTMTDILSAGTMEYAQSTIMPRTRVKSITFTTASCMYRRTSILRRYSFTCLKISIALVSFVSSGMLGGLRDNGRDGLLTSSLFATDGCDPEDDDDED
mmetsp:Transcript_20023/g.41881  ORF Transcript_20023/g.41881 Transcript_20023/m.41881 type:complete len:204 (-) Transcript_20023:275-886(-)